MNFVASRIVLVVYFLFNTETVFANKCMRTVEEFSMESHLKFRRLIKDTGSGILTEVKITNPPALLGHYLGPKLHEILSQSLLTMDFVFSWINGGHFFGKWTTPHLTHSVSPFKPGTGNEAYLHIVPKQDALIIGPVLTSMRELRDKFDGEISDLKTANLQIYGPLYQKWVATKSPGYEPNPFVFRSENENGRTMESKLNDMGLPTDFNFYRENRILGFKAVTGAFETAIIIINPYEIKKMELTPNKGVEIMEE